MSSLYMKKTYFLISIFIFLIIFAIIINPKIYIKAFSNGLEIWATILLPTIFPLIFFTKILTDLGVISTIANKFTITTKLFKTPPISAYAFFISIMSGYPVGAKLVSDLYSDGYVTKQEAFKMTTFTSNSGPMFIYGSVGIGMLFSRQLGIIILISHIFSAVLNGILYRNYSQNTILSANKLLPKNNFSLQKSMSDSIISILIIGGFICIFFVFIEILNNLQVFAPLAQFFSYITGINSDFFVAIFNGILEMTHGCLDIAQLNLPVITTTIIISGLITFGGIATMLQAFAFLQKIGMNIKFFLLQKITQTIIAMLICFLLCLIFVR